MTTYPNQKIVTIYKIQDQEGLKDNLILLDDDWQAACQDLTYTAFKIYLYFASHENNYLLTLSPTEIRSRIKMSENSYHKAISELIEKGYLLCNNTDKNQYSFHPNSIKSKK